MTTASASASPGRAGNGGAGRVTVRGHPFGLFILFTTEMWERFSYYGMRALLVYYMMKQLAYPQAEASTIYGWYTGLVYLTPLFGGLLADRWLGQRRTVILGGVLMSIGHFMMAFEHLFFPALGVLILGNGAFKPNISTQVGLLYAQGDHRRDRAYSIFYVGINVGAFFSPLVCGTLGELYGWHYGFGAAGVGMVIGLMIYLLGQKHLAPDHLARRSAGETRDEPLGSDDWSRIGGLITLCLFTAIFWATFEQQGNTLALWADANTNRRVFAFLGSSWEMPASWFQSFNPAMIFLFTPLVTSLWTRQARRGREPATVTKMAIGCLLVGLSYIVMIAAARANGSGMRASILWLVVSSALITIGELYISPIGLSLVTKLAPARMVSMLMGVWFLSIFGGNKLSGWLGTFWETMSKEAYFVTLCLLATGAGLGMLAILRPLKRAVARGRTGEADV